MHTGTPSISLGRSSCSRSRPRPSSDCLVGSGWSCTGAGVGSGAWDCLGGSDWRWNGAVIGVGSGIAGSELGSSSGCSDCVM